MKKAIKYYLIGTSIFFHAIILISLFWIIPFFNNASTAGKSWAESAMNPDKGIIEDVSTLEQDGLKYQGYKINYNDRTLYTMGTGNDEFEIGQTVNVMVNAHPYGPLKTLMVTITPER
jgi:hypothetical protein